MADLSGQEFYDVSFDQSPQPEQPSPKINPRIFVIGGIVLAVLAVIVIGYILINNMVQDRQQTEMSDQVMIDAANGRMEEELLACEQTENVEACKNQIRSEMARAIGEVTICDDLEGEPYVNCVSLIAYDRLDEKICRVLEDSNKIDCEDTILLIQAQNEINLKTCKRISDEEVKITCQDTVQNIIIQNNSCAEHGLDESLCDQEQEIRAASASGNPADCEQFSFTAKEKCLGLIESTDADSDGLFLSDEFAYGTSDQNPDTDGDLITDFYEIDYYGTDPLNPDTDGDGFDDGTEVANGFDPTN